MRYRSITDIFPVGYHFLPSEVEVRRQCRRWLDIAHDEYNLLIITGQINQIVDPYLKEYTTVVMHNLLLQEAANLDSDYRLNNTCLEALETDFRRIISNVWNEQIRESMNTAYDREEGIHVEQDTRDVQTLETTSEANMQLILSEIRRAHARIDKMEGRNAAYLWPTYTANATDEDKRIFENYLRQLCASNKRSATAEIKKYLKLKEKQGIIIRPQQINSEYDILETFGYSKSPKAYYNNG